MKKIFIGLLTMVYMMVSSGIAMEIHYCMGKKAGIDLYGSKDDKCGRCGMKDNNSGCCHDEFKFVKLEDSHKNVYNTICFNAGEKSVYTPYPLYNWQLVSPAVMAHVSHHSPPDYAGPSVSVLNCVFRL